MAGGAKLLTKHDSRKEIDGVARLLVFPLNRMQLLAVPSIMARQGAYVFVPSAAQNAKL